MMSLRRCGYATMKMRQTLGTMSRQYRPSRPLGLMKSRRSREQPVKTHCSHPPGFSANHLFGDVDDDDPAGPGHQPLIPQTTWEGGEARRIQYRRHRELRPASPTFHRGVMMQEQHARLGGTTDKELLPSFEGFQAPWGTSAASPWLVQEEKPAACKREVFALCQLLPERDLSPRRGNGSRAAATGDGSFRRFSSWAASSFQNPFSAQLGGPGPASQQLQARPAATGSCPTDVLIFFRPAVSATSLT